MDYTACSCESIRKSAFTQAAMDNRDAVQSARTLGAAAGLVFHATHNKNEDTAMTKNCRTCIMPIGEAIVEAGLRPATELAAFKEKMRTGKNCGGCEAQGQGCKTIAFDYSPL